jgi:hypothetical protein
MVSLAVMCGAALAAVSLSALAFWGARSLVAAAELKRDAGHRPFEAALEVLQQRVDELQAQVRQVRPLPAAPAGGPSPLRAGLNLDSRSQALRMHRRGEPPAGIAAALGLPLQEVELLLKVHQIVLRSI